MGKLIYFPGITPPKKRVRSYDEMLEELATELLKVISETFIEARWEMGPAQIWYEEVMKFLEARDIPENALESSIESALRDYKVHWRHQIREFIAFEQSN